MKGEKRVRNPELFAAHFEEHLEAFRRRTPFRRPEQLKNHRETIQLRLQLGSARAAIESDDFTALLHRTLRSWGIGVRRSRLLPLASFRQALHAQAAALEELESVRIDDAMAYGEQVWQVIQSLGIVTNDAPLVASTKALHHILPELIVPVDRKFTQRFFGWQNPQFQYAQKKCFLVAHTFFVQVTRLAEPRRFIGDTWFTSVTKIIDNAIVGAVQNSTAQDVTPGHEE